MTPPSPLPTLEDLVEHAMSLMKLALARKKTTTADYHGAIRALELAAKLTGHLGTMPSLETVKKELAAAGYEIRPMEKKLRSVK